MILLLFSFPVPAVFECSSRVSLILLCLPAPVAFPDPAVFACSRRVSLILPCLHVPVVFACSSRVPLILLCLPVPALFACSSCWSLINFIHWDFCLLSCAFGALIFIVVELFLYGCHVFYSIPCLNPSPINVRHFVTLFWEPEFMITFLWFLLNYNIFCHTYENKTGSTTCFKYKCHYRTFVCTHKTT